MGGDKIKTETWVGWVAAAFCAGIGALFVMMTYARGEFESKEYNRNLHDRDKDDLRRIENKIDALAGRAPTWPTVREAKGR